MLSFQTILFISIAISPIWTYIAYENVQVNVFDSEVRDYEVCAAITTDEVEDFFRRRDISLGLGAMNWVPYIREFVKLVPMMCDTIVDRSDWRTVFTKATVDETMHKIFESEIRWIKVTMQTIRSKIKLLTDDNPDTENRKTIATIIHTNLNQVINFFDAKSSLLRKYPLVGSSPLIQLASLVALFNPIAQTLIPMEAMNPQITCKMRDVLLDYRPRSVLARLLKLRAKVMKRDERKASLIKVMVLPYNKHGYNQTNPPFIDCEWGCESFVMKPTDACVLDKFSENVYFGKNIGPTTCFSEYAALLRHRVEEFFPVDLLNSLCVDRQQQQPTGFGWLTINLMNANFHDNNGKDLGNPFVKLYVNDEVVKESPKRNDKIIHDVDFAFETAKISKNSTIKLEIWHTSGFWSGMKLAFSTNGNVDSFLSRPYRENGHNSSNVNLIETMSFWKHEYMTEQ